MDDLEIAIHQLQSSGRFEGLFMIGKDLYLINLDDFRKLKRT